MPILYVSHSVAEVARLATTVVILTDGKVTAVGPVADILPLADSGDGGSVLDAMVARHDEAFQLSVLTSAAGELQVPRLSAPRRRAGARLHPLRATSCCRCSRRGDQRAERAGRPRRRDRPRAAARRPTSGWTATAPR